MAAKKFVTRAERWPVELPGFALNDTHDSDVLVSQLSYEGCQFRSDDSFETGELVELRIIKRGAVQAEVRWSDDGRAGACFLN
jgi:hypothetical protein